MKFNPKLIMIDVDGTLVDSVPDLAFCVDEMMLTLGRKACGKDKVRLWVGNGVEKLVKRALTGELEAIVNNYDYNKAYPIFLELYKKNATKKSHLYDGVVEGLAYLKSKNCRIGCVTNKIEKFSIPLLKYLNIFDNFDIVISGDTLDRNKPDPMPLVHCAKHFNIKTNQCLMIGDSINDVVAARAAGFSIICVSYGYNHGNDISTAKPDLVIDSMTELVKYI